MDIQLREITAPQKGDSMMVSQKKIGGLELGE